MWRRKELKTRAKAVLRISYWKAFLVSLLIAFVGGNSSGGSIGNLGSLGNGNAQNFSSGNSFEMLSFLIIFVIIFSVIMLIAFAFRVFLGYPLEIGSRRFFIQAAQDNVDLNSLGFAFEKQKYFNVLKSMLWRALINFLWYLLLYIPGIVKSYAYRMVPYILADNPDIGYKRALELSNKMTAGHKFKIFVLDLSFIGWFMLGILALFVGVLFVLPYVNATNAELYLALRQNALDNGLCNHEELNINFNL